MLTPISFQELQEMITEDPGLFLDNRDHLGFTPLFNALLVGRLDLAALLVSNGAEDLGEMGEIDGYPIQSIKDIPGYIRAFFGNEGLQRYHRFLYQAGAATYFDNSDCDLSDYSPQSAPAEMAQPHQMFQDEEIIEEEPQTEVIDMQVDIEPQQAPTAQRRTRGILHRVWATLRQIALPSFFTFAQKRR